MLASFWFLYFFYVSHVNCENQNKTFDGVIGNRTFNKVNGTINTNKTLTRAGGPYLVTSDLIISQSAALSVEAGVEVFFLPKVGVHIHGTLDAKGTHSQRISFRAIQCNESRICNNTNSTAIQYMNPGIRLVDGDSYSNGRLELKWNGRWGTVCDSYWDNKDTEVACRHLGFLGAKRHYRHPGSGSIWLKNLACRGNEKSLLSCSSAGMGNVWGCGHYQDVGIECDTLLPYLEDAVYWKGITFTPKNSSVEDSHLHLENVDIVHAVQGILAMKKAPELSKVTITDCVSGLLMENLESSLDIVETKILRCKVGGINVTSSGGSVKIQNVTVQNTTLGDGLVFEQNTDIVDLCSNISQQPSYPLVLNASGATFCSKIFRALPHRTLSAHFRWIAGSDFQLNVSDGNASNRTLLAQITADFAGKTIKSGSSSILEISFSSKSSAREPTYLEFIIIDNEDKHPLLTITSSRFFNNSNSGIAIYGLIGQTKISSTVFKGNGFGLHINQTSGEVSVLSTVFLYNRKYGIYMGNVTGSVTLQSVNSSRNHGSGIAIEKGSIFFLISRCEASENGDQGLHISNQVNSALNISGLDVYENGREGLYFRDFFEDSYVWISNVYSIRNRQEGALLEKLSATQLRVSTSSFNENYYHGFLADKVVSSNVAFWKVFTSDNHNTGLFLKRGKSNISLEYWSSAGNNNNGFYLEAQEGKMWLKNCFVYRNNRNGLKLMDSHYAKLQSFEFYNSIVSESKEYGILIYVYNYAQMKDDNYSITVMNSTVANNSVGGMLVYAWGCSYRYNRLTRQIQLSFVGNEVNGNQNKGLNLRGPEAYKLDALLRDNVFKNNTGICLRLAHIRCPQNDFPVHVEVLSNSFEKNKGDHVVLVDYGYHPDRRFITIKNNTFIDNEALKVFFTRYVRIKTQAVILLGEGNITLEGNVFENPSFPLDIATYLQQHNRIISAKQNWWGTQDECKIKQRIFDFEDRIEVSRIEYYPYLASSDFTNSTLHTGVRPFCFLKGNKLGGILDQFVTLPKRNTIYEVTGDVIVLSNGTLTIEGNVTLEFPLQAVFFVQGKVVIKGEEDRRVRFIPKKPSQKEIRLVDGPGPWNGRLEILVNETWMSVCGYTYYSYLPLTACRQLGYEAYSSSYLYGSGREKMFLRNVNCVNREINNVANCSRDRWISHSRCSSYVLHVHCSNPYWAGVHLGMAAKKSVVKNLDITYAGFRYRSDIPGIAFRVDHTHHEVFGVFINKSANIGLQVIYSYPTPNNFDFQNLIIMNSGSDGIRLQSPFLTLTKTDVVKAHGYGFLLEEPSWGVINKQVLELADPEVMKYMNLCTENVTILSENVLHYYVVVSANLARNCESVIQAPSDFRIGLQIAYNRAHSTFNVYSGTNMSSSDPWEIRRSPIRDTWDSNSSSILLRSSSYYRYYTTEVHFLLYLVKEDKKVQPPSLVLSHVKIMDSATSGILLGTYNLGNVFIQNSCIHGSSGAGLYVGSSRITKLIVSNSLLQENRFGVYFPSFSVSISASIENTKIKNSTSHALYAYSYGSKELHLINSSLTHTKGVGILIDGYGKLSLDVTGTFFGWNERYSVLSYSRCISSFRNNTFLQNTGPVINFRRYWQSVITLENNIFKNNSEPSVIVIWSYYPNEIIIRKNHFTDNLCRVKGIINLAGSRDTKVFIQGNLFERNTGRLIYAEGSSFSPVQVRSNVFVNNNCSNKGAVEIRRMEMDTAITGNIFKDNKGLFMVLLQCVYNINLGMTKQNLTLANNSFIDNTKVSSDVLDCEVNISGILEYKTIYIHHNKFNSNEFSKELCTNVLASPQARGLDAPLNYWGSENISAIRGRIHDARTNYEIISVHFTPFISSKGIAVGSEDQTEEAETLTEEDLGGYISTDVRLVSNTTHYFASSNVIILSNASLTIAPGVEIQFGPSVSVVVFGSLFALGTSEHPVKFTALKRTKKGSLIPVRLFGGNYPWSGRVEVAHKGIWLPAAVCVNHTRSWRWNDAEVVCRQLAYESPRFMALVEDTSPNTSTYHFNFNCFGNETKISDCPINLETLNCNHFFHATIECIGGRPWGNVRFMGDIRNTTEPGKSILEYLEIEHCGHIDGLYAPAVLAIHNVPKLNHVSVVNCSSGGLKVLFAEKELHVGKSSFINTGGNGIEIVGAKRNVTLENITSINNENGVILSATDGKHLQGFYDGQISFCALQSVVNLTKDELFLYFKVPYIAGSNPSITCKKVIQAGTDYALSFQLLFLQKSSYLTFYDPGGRDIIRSSNREERRRLEEKATLPWNRATVVLTGNYDGEVLLKVNRIRMSDLPCTFERYACNWQNYPTSTFQGNALSKNWILIPRYRYYYYYAAGADHTFSSRKGRYMYLGGYHYRYRTTYGAFISLPITKENNTCFLTFYYKLWRTGNAALSVLMEELHDNTTTNGTNSTLLWTTNQTAANWRKKTIRLSPTNRNSSVVFLGYYKAFWYNQAYVAVDDLQFISCDASLHFITHRITDSTVSGNLGYGISFVSNETKSHVFQIQRSKITKNGLRGRADKNSLEGIHLNATNQVFQIINNYIAENKNGGMYVEVQKRSIPVYLSDENYIHGNVIEHNKGIALFLKGTTEQPSDVKLTNNYVSFNLGKNTQGNDAAQSVCNLSNLSVLLQGNLFYNNSGQYIVEFRGIQSSLRFFNNTLYRNRGLGDNYGVTFLCNGAAEMHGNVLQNPKNRFQISTTLQGIPITVNATSNWWGESVLNLVSSLIMDKTTDYRLSLEVIFKPFWHLPPTKALSISCPPEWKIQQELCYLYKGAAFTFKEASEYCEKSGGFIINVESIENKQLVQRLRKEESSLSYLKQVPALWTTKTYLVMKDSKCFVVKNNGKIKESHCGNRHPFVCTRRPVMYCPNSCFHNGECLGAVCFCYPGWTGEDCSQFHCEDLHGCSGSGECVGPNVCKCYAGFMGRGCTYSYCGKYESCADCVRDPFCGWCDSSRSCLGGFPEGPPKLNCPDWFFHHCYTVGGNVQCSNNIQRIDCKGKYCNYEDGGNTESCQKCTDIERCYKVPEDGLCRAWNETQCPGGKVLVDYNDPQRINNVQLAKNVKLVEPNETIIYACPMIPDVQEESSLVFVAPRSLGIKADDILSSPQAGGIMHKIVNVVEDGTLGYFFLYNWNIDFSFYSNEVYISFYYFLGSLRADCIIFS